MSKDEQPKPKTHATHHKSTKKVFDVTRPGHSPAAPNSRSVVPSPKPPVPDDQFVPTAPVLRAGDPGAMHELLDGKKRKDLQPLAASNEQPVEAGPAEASAPDPAAGAPILADMPAQVETSIAPSTHPVSDPAQPANTGEVHTEPTAPNAPAPTTVARDSAPELPNQQPETALRTEPAMPEAPAPTQPAPTAEETPAHFAIEHTVQTTSDMPIWEHPDTSEQGDTGRRANSPHSSKTIEDLLAETGAPHLEPEKTPALIVSHHKTRRAHWWEPILVFVVIILIAAIALNFLLDADIIKTTLSIPHTDLLN